MSLLEQKKAETLAYFSLRKWEKVAWIAFSINRNFRLTGGNKYEKFSFSPIASARNAKWEDSWSRSFISRGRKGRGEDGWMMNGSSVRASETHCEKAGLLNEPVFFSNCYRNGIENQDYYDFPNFYYHLTFKLSFFTTMFRCLQYPISVTFYW